MIVADVVACAYLDVTVDVSETMHEPAPVRVIRPVVLLTVQMDADEDVPKLRVPSPELVEVNVSTVALSEYVAPLEFG